MGSMARLAWDEFVARQDIAERQAGSPLWGVVYSLFLGGLVPPRAELERLRAAPR